MTLLHDRRLITILIATAAVLMAGAVAFATSWLPSVGGSSPKLPMVVTSRPVESPLTSVFASPTPAAAVPATASATATATTTAPPATRPGATVGPPAVTPAPPKAAPKPAQPGREVITPPVREKDEDDDEHSAVISPVRPLGIGGSGRSDAHDSDDEARHESAGDDREREERSTHDGDAAKRGGDERHTERGKDSKSAR